MLISRLNGTIKAPKIFSHFEPVSVIRQYLLHLMIIVSSSFVCRMEGFIKSGVVQFEDRPIWYDVLKSFPPPIWPDWLRPEPKYIEKLIFYSQDRIRATFPELSIVAAS